MTPPRFTTLQLADEAKRTLGEREDSRRTRLVNAAKEARIAKMRAIADLLDRLAKQEEAAGGDLFDGG